LLKRKILLSKNKRKKMVHLDMSASLYNMFDVFELKNLGCLSEGFEWRYQLSFNCLSIKVSMTSCRAYVPKWRFWIDSHVCQKFNIFCLKLIFFWCFWIVLMCWFQKWINFDLHITSYYFKNKVGAVHSKRVFIGCGHMVVTLEICLRN
jgi:hypothetical protein